MSRNIYIRNYSSNRARNIRQKMLAKIHIEYQRLRPDLRHSTEELREERLLFCQNALGLSRPPASLRDLTDKQLGRVIEAIAKEYSEPKLPGCDAHGTRASVRSNLSRHCSANDMISSSSAEVIHLASEEQTWAINRIFEYLGWSPEGRTRFIEGRFNRKSEKLLKPNEAQSLTFILLRIAASNDLKKDSRIVRVTKSMIGSYIPQLKKKLGIEQGGSK